MFNSGPKASQKKILSPRISMSWLVKSERKALEILQCALKESWKIKTHNQVQSSLEEHPHSNPIKY